MFGRRDTKETIDYEDKPKLHPVKRYGNIVGEVLRIQDVIGFFKYDINPSYLDAKVEASLAKQQRGIRQVPFGWIIGIGALLLFGAIAFMMVSGQLNQGTCNQQLTSCLTAGARVVTSATNPQPSGILGAAGVTVK